MGRRVRLGGRRTSILLLVLLGLLILSPAGVASAAPPPLPSPNDACRPADNPPPQPYGSGIDGMIKPPGHPSPELQRMPWERMTYYDRYGTAGQIWYAVDMGCSDGMAMVGNAAANVAFTLAKAIDRTTITVYQAAASESLLTWLKRTVDDVIGGIGDTFGTQYWSWIVILGALWLAWWGLLRKRASRVAEGTIWMIAAMVALTWLVNRPADFTTLGTTISQAATTAFNAALPQSDPSGSTCIPSDHKPDQSDVTTRNANGLWVALVCKPWLMGEFGTTDPKSAIVKQNADKLLWSQAIDLPDSVNGKQPDLEKKAEAYKEVANNIKENHASVYPLFQGKEWTTRLAISFGALFAALIAGVLILVIAIALIVVKIAFLLLLVAGPFFLGIGIHPGVGRVIAVRWFELLLSMLLKQAALIGVLALLLWCYSLILTESLPWGLQILLIALVTFAAFVYRKPFQHLFAAVGYSAAGARAKGEQQLEKASVTARKSTAELATAVPGVAGYRLARWARRNPEQVAGLAAGRAGGDGTTTGSRPDGTAGDGGEATGGGIAGKKGPSTSGTGSARSRRGAPPLNLPRERGSGGGGGGGGNVPDTPSGGGRFGGGLAVPFGRSGGDGSGRTGGGGGGGGVPDPRGGSGGGLFGGGGRSREGDAAPRGGGTPNPVRQRASTGGRRDGGHAARAEHPSGPRDTAPPLWARSSPHRREPPPMPFWLRPADGDRTKGDQE